MKVNLTQMGPLKKQKRHVFWKLEQRPGRASSGGPSPAIPDPPVSIIGTMTAMPVTLPTIIVKHNRAQCYI